MKECICPIVEIRCLDGHVSEQQVKKIADDLNAMVSRNNGLTMYGKHRTDCPCHPNYIKVERV